jgi:hypothetical protein
VAGGVVGGAYKYSKSKEGYERAYAACMSGQGYTTGAGSAPAPAPVVATPVVAQPVAVAVAQPAVVAAVPRSVHIPPGAFILYNGVAWDGDYDWRAHSRRQPGSVPSVIVEISTRR